MLRQAVVERINTGHNFPAFPATVQKLNGLLLQEDCSIVEVANLIETDPGLAIGCIKLANSAAFSGTDRKHTVRDAVMRLGFREIRRLTFSIGIVGSVSHMKVVRLDWQKYWLHSVLTARLTELLTGAYQALTGMEYLAGLIHDIGKLLIEHHFPREFETVILELRNKANLTEMELRTIGITHAEVCSLIAARWNLDRDIVQAVRLHHIDERAELASLGHSPSQQIKVICLALANRLANQIAANIDRDERVGQMDLEAMPEWAYLQNFSPWYELEFDLDVELAKAQETLGSLPARRAAAAPQ